MLSKLAPPDQDTPPVPAPKSHGIVLVAAKTAWHTDQTKSNVTLAPGAIFAHVRFVHDILRICPTINLPGDPEDVFLGHDGRPNLVYDQFKSTLTVDHGGITKGDILMCRCTQNTIVQHANHIVGIVPDQICTAFDQRDLIPKHDWVGYERGEEGVEHSEEGGGVLIGEGLGGWEAVREGMERLRWEEEGEAVEEIIKAERRY